MEPGHVFILLHIQPHSRTIMGVFSDKSVAMGYGNRVKRGRWLASTARVNAVDNPGRTTTVEAWRNNEYWIIKFRVHDVDVLSNFAPL